MKHPPFLQASLNACEPTPPAFSMICFIKCLLSFPSSPATYVYWIFLFSVNMNKGSSVLQTKNPEVGWTTLLWFHNLLKALSLLVSLLLFTVLEPSRRRIQNPIPLLPHCVLHLFWFRSAADPPPSPKPRGDRTPFPAPPTAGQSPVLTGKENLGQRSGCLSDFQGHWTCCYQSVCPISSLEYGCLWSRPKTLFSLWILYNCSAGCVLSGGSLWQPGPMSPVTSLPFSAQHTVSLPSPWE